MVLQDSKINWDPDQGQPCIQLVQEGEVGQQIKLYSLFL